MSSATREAPPEQALGDSRQASGEPVSVLWLGQVVDGAASHRLRFEVSLDPARDGAVARSAPAAGTSEATPTSRTAATRTPATRTPATRTAAARDAPTRGTARPTAADDVVADLAALHVLLELGEGKVSTLTAETPNRHARRPPAGELERRRGLGAVGRRHPAIALDRPQQLDERAVHALTTTRSASGGKRARAGGGR